MRYCPGVVGPRRPHARQLSSSLVELRPHRPHVHVRHRVTSLVGDTAADHPGTLKSDLELLERLSRGQFQDLALAPGTSLPILRAEIPAACDVDGVAAGGKAGELEFAAQVGTRAFPFAEIRGRQADLGPAQRPALFEGHDATTDDCSVLVGRTCGRLRQRRKTRQRAAQNREADPRGHLRTTRSIDTGASPTVSFTARSRSAVRPSGS